MVTYHDGLCVHPTNDSVQAICHGLVRGAFQALQDIKMNCGQERYKPGQQESFGRGYYDGYATAWTIANATLPKQNISNNSGTSP